MRSQVDSSRVSVHTYDIFICHQKRKTKAGTDPHWLPPFYRNRSDFSYIFLI